MKQPKDERFIYYLGVVTIMTNESLRESLDERVCKFDGYLVREIGKLLQRPYAERADIEDNLKPYTTIRNALRSGYKTAFGKDLTDTLQSSLPSIPMLEELDFSTRVRNILNRAQIHTTEDLLKIPERDLLTYKDCGKVSVAEVKTKLEMYGLSLS